MRFEFSAGGIVFRKIKGQIEVALILDAYGRWTFPKGHIEKGEKPDIAALREVGEELGVANLKIVQLLNKIEYWFKMDGDLIHKFVYFYLMEAPEKAILKPQTAEIKDARWFSSLEARTILGYKKDSLEILEKAIEVLKKINL